MKVLLILVLLTIFSTASDHHKCDPTNTADFSGEHSGCCTELDPCPLHHGDCNNDLQCQGALKCNIMNDGKTYGYNSNQIDVCGTEKSVIHQTTTDPLMKGIESTVSIEFDGDYNTAVGLTNLERNLFLTTCTHTVDPISCTGTHSSETQDIVIDFKGDKATLIDLRNELITIGLALPEYPLLPGGNITLALTDIVTVASDAGTLPTQQIAVIAVIAMLCFIVFCSICVLCCHQPEFDDDLERAQTSRDLRDMKLSQADLSALTTTDGEHTASSNIIDDDIQKSYPKTTPNFTVPKTVQVEPSTDDNENSPNTEDREKTSSRYDHPQETMYTSKIDLKETAIQPGTAIEIPQINTNKTTATELHSEDDYEEAVE